MGVGGPIWGQIVLFFFFGKGVSEEGTSVDGRFVS